MAHGNRRRQRDASVPSLGDVDSLLSDVVPEVLIDPVSEDFTPGSLLSEVNDARRFDPDFSSRMVNAAPNVVGDVARVVPGRDVSLVRSVREAMEFPERFSRLPLPRWSDHVGFVREGYEALECVRRRIRKEVMFSLPSRKRRKGAGAKRRRDEWSNVRC